MPFLLKPKEKDICTILRNAKVAKVGLTNFNKKNKKKEEPKKEIIIQIDYTNHILDFINDKDIRIREDWITFESNHFNTWEEEKKFFLKQHSK